MMRIGIISNPFAKMNKKNPKHNKRLWSILGNAGQLEITRSLSELETVCQEFQERKINLVGIVGGDGSISLVLSYLFKAYGPHNLPKILLLKGGTINFLAGNLGISSDGVKCLKDTLRLLSQNKPLYEIPVSTIRVEERIGFLFANGVASHFLEEYYKNKTGPLGAALKIGQTLLDGAFFGKINGQFQKIISHFPLKINEKHFSRHMLTFVSTVPKLPFGIHLFRKLTPHENLFEMIVIAGCKKQILKETIFSFLIGKLHQASFIQSSKLKNAVIECPQNSFYSLDGDLITTKNGKIHITMGPRFTFCSPYNALDFLHKRV